MDSRIFIIGRDELPQRLHLKGGESLRWTFVWMEDSRVPLDPQIDLDGPGCEVDIAGLYLCGPSSRFDIRTVIRHNAGGCVSRQLFKGVASEGGKVNFDGLVYVAPDAQKTKAYQENHTILLSPGALVQTSPQLEIYADDVECSHGATTGFLSEDELFYMRSRGIPFAQARRLQLISFLWGVLSRLPSALADKISASL